MDLSKTKKAMQALLFLKSTKNAKRDRAWLRTMKNVTAMVLVPQETSQAKDSRWKKRKMYCIKRRQSVSFWYLVIFIALCQTFSQKAPDIR